MVKDNKCGRGYKVVYITSRNNYHSEYKGNKRTLEVNKWLTFANIIT